MFDNQKQYKIENHKIQSWRLELASFFCAIAHRPRKHIAGPNNLSRASCASIVPNLQDIYEKLFYPGVRRLFHFVHSKNYPFLMDDVMRMCKVCAELKTKFYRPEQGKLIKATQPFARLSNDFKEPFASELRNVYLLTIVDEYSHFFLLAVP